jgi:hypothetical protein
VTPVGKTDGGIGLPLYIVIHPADSGLTARLTGVTGSNISAFHPFHGLQTMPEIFMLTCLSSYGFPGDDEVDETGYHSDAIGSNH